MTRWRVLLVGALSGLLLLAHFYAPRPEIPEAWAQGVGIFSRATCTTLSSVVVGQTFCFDQTANALKFWNGTTWVQTATANQVNVKDFGAKGDGTTDDTAAIQSVLNLTNTGAGGVVAYLPCGIYIVSATMTIYSSTTIQGCGIDGTIIKVAAGSTNVTPLATRTGFGITSSITIRDLTVDGNKANVAVGSGGILEGPQSNLYLDQVDETLLDHIKSVNAVNSGLYSVNSSTRLMIRSSIFQNNGKATAVGGRGIAVNVSPTYYQIIGNQITGSLQQGILFQNEGGSDAADSIIANNTIDTSGSHGLDLTDNQINAGTATDRLTHRITIIGNVFQANTGAGLRISENTVANVNGKVAIAQNIAVVGNVSDANLQEGMLLTTSNGGLVRRISVTGNTIQNNTGNGITLGNSQVSDVTIQANVILGNGGTISNGGTGTSIGVNKLTASTADAEMGSSLRNTSVGPHSFGGATDTRYQFLLSGAFTPSGTAPYAGVELESSIAPAANASAYAMQINPTLTRPGSGTTPEYASLNLLAPGVGGSATTISTMTTLNLATAPSNGGTNHFFRVGLDLFRIMADGGVLIASATKGNQGVGTLNIASATFLNGFPEAVASATGVNLLSIRGLSASQSLSNNLGGTCTFSAAVTCTVAFANNEPDANYKILVGGLVTVSAKARSGFLMTATGTNSNAVDWMLLR